MTDTRIALIPAYQPTKTLCQLASELREAGFLVVVVDDGSGEAYQPVFDAMKSMGTVLSYPDNQGKGGALRELSLRWMRTVNIP